MAERKPRAKKPTGGSAKRKRKKPETAPVVYLEPWERQADETHERYSAFLIYRDQPAQGQLRRSLERAAHACGKSPSTLEQWSRQDRWRERVQAWDRHLQAVQDAAKVRKLTELAEREALQLHSATQTLQAPIVALLTRIQTVQGQGEDPWEKINISDLTTLAIRSARAMPHVIVGERLVHGLSTTNAQVDVTGDVRIEDARRQAEAMSPVERDRFLLGETVDDGRGGAREKAARRLAERAGG